MKSLEEQFSLLQDSVILSAPVVSLSPLSYHSGFELVYNDQAQFNPSKLAQVDQLLIPLYKNFVRVTLDVDMKRYRFAVSFPSFKIAVLHAMHIDIMSFLKLKGGFANNRLSKIYKWYNTEVHEGTMSRNNALAEDLYNTYKLINSEDAEKHTDAIRIILQMIKNRYEKNPI